MAKRYKLVLFLLFVVLVAMCTETGPAGTCVGFAALLFALSLNLSGAFCLPWPTDDNVATVATLVCAAAAFVKVTISILVISPPSRITFCRIRSTSTAVFPEPAG